MGRWLVMVAIVACNGDKGATDPTDATDADADSDADSDADTDTGPCGDDVGTDELHLSGTTVGEADDYDSRRCPTIGGGEDWALEYTAPATGRYRVDTEGSGMNDVLVAYDGCGGAELACADVYNFGYPDQYESLVLDLVAGQLVVLVVDSFDGPGPFELGVVPVPSVETVCDDGVDEDYDLATDCADPDCATTGPCVETVCDDGIDDDGNFLVDCLDPDCALAPNCAVSCPTLTLPGLGSIGGTTVGAPDSGQGTCDFSSPSPDASIAFTAPATSTYGFATVELATNFETVLYVLDGCGGAELGCDNTINPGGGGDTVVVDLVAGQTVVAVVDGIGGGAGPFELAVFDLAGTEAGSCDDGVDNDFDGLIDCDDRDCDGDPTCVETCDDGVDNDGDGQVDCQDHECEVLPVCVEICDNGVDDDDDFRTDCFDLACDVFPACLEAVCDDGIDDNSDGFVDCADTDCRDFVGCAEICDDGVDNDGDFRVDCADTACAGALVCIELCADGLDNDGDYGVDCADPDCDLEVACIETRCGDGNDNDGNYLTDCRDPDCDLSPACAEVCNDGFDNDNDFLTDCADSWCAADPVCLEVCNDGVDNDGNYLVDCFDPDCATFGTCAEVCDDGQDNDHDNLLDCFDPACDFDAVCAEDCANARDDDGDTRADCLDLVCADDAACARDCPQFELGALPVVFAGDTYGAPDGFRSRCGPDASFGLFASASDAAHAFTAPADGDYTFDARGSSFNVLLSILDGDCAGEEIVCESSAFTANPMVTVPLTAGQTVIVVVDGIDAGNDGPYVLTVY